VAHIEVVVSADGLKLELDSIEAALDLGVGDEFGVDRHRLL